MQERALRVLIADGDPDVLMTLSLHLRTEGYDTRAIMRGAAVAESIDEYDPDVVLLDLALPDVGGRDLARALRERYRGWEPTLVALAGVSACRADLAEFDHQIGKPCDPMRLTALLAPLARRLDVPQQSPDLKR